MTTYSCTDFYTLLATQDYDGKICRMRLDDTLSNLYLVVSKYKYVILTRRDDYYVLSQPSKWEWRALPDLYQLQLGRLKLEPDHKIFPALEQALAYLDICT